MSKVLWLDTETTGLHNKINGLTELAAIMIIDKKEVGRIELKINPYSYNRDIRVDQEALNLTCKTEEMLKSYPNSFDQFTEFIKFISAYGSKIQIAGYNINFDIGFLKSWFDDNNTMPLSPQFSDFFSYKEVDTFSLVKQMKYLGFFETKNDKLETLCNHFNINIFAHNAIDDIVATMKLQEKLVSLFMGKDDDFEYGIKLHINKNGKGKMDLDSDTPNKILVRAIALMTISLLNSEERTLQELVQDVVSDIQDISTP